MDFLAILQTNVGYLPFLFILAIMAFILYKAHAAELSTFSIYHLVTDGVSGKGSVEKIGMLLAQLTTTWWFVDKAAKNLATIEDVMVYGGLMGLARLADKFIGAKYGNKDTPQQ